MKQKKFLFVSDAKAFQRKKQKEGYKTRLFRGINPSHPHHVVKYTKKEEAGFY